MRIADTTHKNKLTKFNRRCASQDKVWLEKVWAPKSFGGKELKKLLVGHHVHLHVGDHVSHHVGHHNVISTLCEGSETLAAWQPESVTDQSTYGLTGVGASKNTTCRQKPFRCSIPAAVV